MTPPSLPFLNRESVSMWNTTVSAFGPDFIPTLTAPAVNEAYNFTAFNFSQESNTNLTITPINLDFLIAHDADKEPIVIRALRSFRDIFRISVSRTWFPPVFLPIFRGHEKYAGCSASQQSLIHSAAGGATTLASFTNSYISSTTSGTPRYRTWFGEYDSERRDTVRSHFSLLRGNDFLGFTCVSKLLSLMFAPDLPISYDCTCSDAGVYAKVSCPLHIPCLETISSFCSSIRSILPFLGSYWIVFCMGTALIYV